MTDNETIKVLEEAVNKANEIINRQKAEIERLEKLNIIYKGGVDYFKSEAIKKFAERLKLHSYIVSDESQAGIVCRYSVVTTSQIDTIAKELIDKQRKEDESNGNLV